jgi:hypothetical protein
MPAPYHAEGSGTMWINGKRILDFFEEVCYKGIVSVWFSYTQTCLHKIPVFRDFVFFPCYCYNFKSPALISGGLGTKALTKDIVWS